jgi:hypothetical protein
MLRYWYSLPSFSVSRFDIFQGISNGDHTRLPLHTQLSTLQVTPSTLLSSFLPDAFKLAVVAPGDFTPQSFVDQPVDALAQLFNANVGQNFMRKGEHQH